MNVILDTNILFNNYRLDTPRFQGLFSYLKKTKSQLFIPEITLNEVLKEYNKGVDKFINRYETGSRIFLDSTRQTLDGAKIKKEYMAFLFRQITDKRIKVMEQGKVSLEELVERSLEEMPPFKNDRGFRDTLIWFSILKTLETNKKDDFCFITDNKIDFGDTNLHKNLVADLGKNSKRLMYLNSLDDFLSQYAEKLTFLNERLLASYLLKQGDELINFLDIDILKPTIERENSGYEILGVNKISLNTLDVQDFYVYSSTKTRYKVRVSIVLYLDFEIVIENPGYEYELVIGQPYPDTELSYGSNHCWLDLTLTITKKNRKIEIDSKSPPEVLYPA